MKGCEQAALQCVLVKTSHAIWVTSQQDGIGTCSLGHQVPSDVPHSLSLGPQLQGRHLTPVCTILLAGKLHSFCLTVCTAGLQPVTRWWVPDSLARVCNEAVKGGGQYGVFALEPVTLHWAICPLSSGTFELVTVDGACSLHAVL